MPRPMPSKQFYTLSKRDFDNGAVTEEIYTALKQRESLVLIIQEICREAEESEDSKSFNQWCINYSPAWLKQAGLSS